MAKLQKNGNQEEEKDYIIARMEIESCVPPGFRFHPTEEELVGYYLKSKVESLKIQLQVIVDLDLYRMEPWDIQDRCKLGYEEQNEWYFFSHKDRKYPTGTRTNRATAAGFWKATGRDKAVLSKERMIGMRKTLVFYKGRAPDGRRTDWIMHEYRLQTTQHAPPQEEGWVVCRAFKKPTPSQKQNYQPWNSNNISNNYINNAHYFPNNVNFMPLTPFQHHTSPILHHQNQSSSNLHHSLPSGSESLLNYTCFDNQLTDLPQLDSSAISKSLAANDLLSDHEHERKNIASIDWDKMDNLLPVYSNTTFIPCDNEVDAQSQISQFLECFPDL